MNLNQAPQPMQRAGIRKRIAALWSSRNRISRLVILATTGLVLNCCCVIIPLSTQATGVAAQSNGVHAISTPAATTAQDAFAPTTLAISAQPESESRGAGRVGWRNFNLHPDAQADQRTAGTQVNEID
jgi:hypothetical protein